MGDQRCYLGLISGTSADGIDAALVRFADSSSSGRVELLHACTYPYPETLRAEVLDYSQREATLTLDAVGALDTRLGRAFADAAQRLIAEAGLDRARIAAIGSHGQTLRHRPDGDAPFTLQLGDPNVIAERCGITVVADFRRRDLAAGGHAAPLMPAFHAAMLRDAAEDRAVLNLGGIANLTLLPREGAVRGFDTGPANGLMDAWHLRHRGVAFDAGGAFAAGGRVQATLLQRLLDEPWFALSPPKSTGRDQFHLDWLDARLQVSPPVAQALAAEDVQATLCELSAATVADALRATQPATARVLACGGGVHNGFLMARLAEHLAPARLESTAACGLDPDFVEAMGFAWLARETLAGRSGNLPEVTGARGPRVLGAIYSA